MSSRLLCLAAIATLGTLSACAPVDPGMGEALKYDMLAQTVNPEPVYTATGAQPGANGVLGAAASERYRKDQVKAVVRESTASGSSGGGGSGPK